MKKVILVCDFYESYKIPDRVFNVKKNITLFPIATKPLIEYILEQLYQNNFKKVYLVGLHVNKILEYIKITKYFRYMEFTCLNNFRETFGDVMRDIDEQDLGLDDLLIYYANTYSNLSLDFLYKKHRESRKKNKKIILTGLFIENNPRISTNTYIVKENEIHFYKKIHSNSRFKIKPFIEKLNSFDVRSHLSKLRIFFVSEDIFPLFTENFDCKTIEDLINSLFYFNAYDYKFRVLEPEDVQISKRTKNFDESNSSLFSLTSQIYQKKIGGDKILEDKYFEVEKKNEKFEIVDLKKKYSKVISSLQDYFEINKYFRNSLKNENSNFQAKNILSDSVDNKTHNFLFSSQEILELEKNMNEINLLGEIEEDYDHKLRTELILELKYTFKKVSSLDFERKMKFVIDYFEKKFKKSKNYENYTVIEKDFPRNLSFKFDENEKNKINRQNMEIEFDRKIENIMKKELSLDLNEKNKKFDFNKYFQKLKQLLIRDLSKKENELNHDNSISTISKIADLKSKKDSELNNDYSIIGKSRIGHNKDVKSCNISDGCTVNADIVDCILWENVSINSSYSGYLIISNTDDGIIDINEISDESVSPPPEEKKEISEEETTFFSDTLNYLLRIYNSMTSNNVDLFMIKKECNLLRIGWHAANYDFVEVFGWFIAETYNPDDFERSLVKTACFFPLISGLTKETDLQYLLLNAISSHLQINDLKLKRKLVTEFGFLLLEDGLIERATIKKYRKIMKQYIKEKKELSPSYEG